MAGILLRAMILPEIQSSGMLIPFFNISVPSPPILNLFSGRDIIFP
jgi:hypothetical protein